MLARSSVAATLSALLAALCATAQPATWTSLGPAGAHVSAVTIDPLDHSPYAGTSGAGIFVNHGNGWEASDVGLTSPNIRVLSHPPFFCPEGALCALPAIYAGTQGGGIAQSVGQSWTLVNAGLTDLAVAALAFDPGGGIYAATGSGVFKSAGVGLTWATSLVTPDVRAVAVDPSNPSVGYAGASLGLFKTIDGGQTWSQLQTSTLFFLSAVQSIAIDPNAPAVVYAAGIQSCHLCEVPAIPAVMRSDDGGLNWQAIIAGLPNPVVALLANSDSTVFAGTSGGVFRTSDRGTTWTAFNDGLSNLSVLSLATDGSSLYAGTDGGGIFQAGPIGDCFAGPNVLCLSSGRFRIEVVWNAAAIGEGGAGQTSPMTADTGAFWFFQPSSIELVIKVLDGRAINGHFWVFYGALTNVGYTITVTDTTTGTFKKYVNPEGQLASVADTEAF